MFCHKIIEGHTALRIVAGHRLADLFDDGIAFRAVGFAELLHAPALAHAIEFAGIAARDQRRVPVAQRDAKMLHDLVDGLFVSGCIIFADIREIIGHDFSLVSNRGPPSTRSGHQRNLNVCQSSFPHRCRHSAKHDVKSMPKRLFARIPLFLVRLPHYIRFVGLTDYGDKLTV